MCLYNAFIPYSLTICSYQVKEHQVKHPKTEEVIVITTTTTTTCRKSRNSPQLYYNMMLNASKLTQPSRNQASVSPRKVCKAPLLQSAFVVVSSPAVLFAPQGSVAIAFRSHLEIDLSINWIDADADCIYYIVYSHMYIYIISIIYVYIYIIIFKSPETTRSAPSGYAEVSALDHESQEFDP